MFIVSLESNDRKLLEQVEKYARGYGVHSNGVQEVELENEEVQALALPEIRHALPMEDTTPYDIYGMMRGSELGYVGVTKMGAAYRIAQHIRKAEQASEPFIQWLIEGLERHDLKGGLITTSIGYSDAVGTERRLIQSLKPRFNKRDGVSGLINKIGGLSQLQIEE